MVAQLADGRCHSAVHGHVGDVLDDVEPGGASGGIERELGTLPVAGVEGEPGRRPERAAVEAVLGAEVGDRHRALVQRRRAAGLVVQRVRRLDNRPSQATDLGPASDDQVGPGPVRSAPAARRSRSAGRTSVTSTKSRKSPRAFAAPRLRAAASSAAVPSSRSRTSSRAWSRTVSSARSAPVSGTTTISRRRCVCARTACSPSSTWAVASAPTVTTTVTKGPPSPARPGSPRPAGHDARLFGNRRSMRRSAGTTVAQDARILLFERVDRAGPEIDSC